LVIIRNRIYISFNLWTSLNAKPLVDVIFYFLDKDLKIQNLLAEIKRVRGVKTGENITKAVIPIIEGIVSGKRLGFFIENNASKNSIIIRAILTHLYLDLKDPDSRRVRYLGYIINLNAKAFLFSKNADAFKEDSRIKKELSKFEAVRELWRKKGPVGKFHNTIYFIRKNPQRRKAFLETCGSRITPDIKGKRL
jgi:hypothetical protein